MGKGSRRAKAAAAACLAALAIASALPQPAAAYPCGDGKAASTQTRELAGVSPDECRVPETLKRARPTGKARKKGNMSGLTVFVLAVAAALLIPIGRNGPPHGGDPFGHDPTYERRA
jgi:hypothetical protein